MADPGVKFARKYGKKFGGVLILEGAQTGKDHIKHKDLPDAETSEGLVRLLGLLIDAKGREIGAVTTPYVLGFGINRGQLYVITHGPVYRVVGEWYPQVISETPFLNGLWKELSGKILARAKGKA